MATLTALKFQTAESATHALVTLADLQRQALLQVEDAAIVTWTHGAKKPKTRQALNTTGAGAVGGAFWGMLFGLIFFVPLLGAALGAAAGAVSGAFTDVGIDDDFIAKLREQVTEGSSALFVLENNAVADRVVAALKPLQPEVSATNLSAAQEEQLWAAFAEE